MKKQIEIATKSTKTIEVEIPSYYNFHGKYTAITDHAVIGVWTEGNMISINLASKADRYNQCIDEVLGLYGTQSVTKQEFETAFNNTIKCLTEQYQLSMSMQDPNLQAAGPDNQEAIKEQATAEGQEVAATESAAQDTAMEVESAEEGSTEG
jgi:hypothetical protein